MEKKEKTGFYRCRVNAGVSQQEAAELLGVSRTTLWAWETGSTSPDAKKLRRMSEIYGCRVAELLKEGVQRCRE